MRYIIQYRHRDDKEWSICGTPKFYKKAKAHLERLGVTFSSNYEFRLMRVTLGGIKPQKCYISGQMTHLSKDEWVKNFSEAEKKVMEMGYEPVNPATSHLPEWMPWILCIIYDLVWVMHGCRVIYMQANWLYSKGASIERLWAEKRNWTIIYEKSYG